MLEHAQTKRDQSVVRCQRPPINESDRDTLARVGDRLDRCAEHQLVRSEELGFFLNDRLETTLVDGKLVVLGETSRSDIEGVVVTLVSGPSQQQESHRLKTTNPRRGDPRRLLR
jgi:hypothetical protein